MQIDPPGPDGAISAAVGAGSRNGVTGRDSWNQSVNWADLKYWDRGLQRTQECVV